MSRRTVQETEPAEEDEVGPGAEVTPQVEVAYGGQAGAAPGDSVVVERSQNEVPLAEQVEIGGVRETFSEVLVEAELSFPSSRAMKTSPQAFIPYLFSFL